jgi:hypothetical protein
LARNDLLGSAPEPSAGCRPLKPWMKDPLQHPCDVGIHRSGRALEGKGGDGTGGVPADAGQPPKLGRFGWNAATQLPNHGSGQTVQIGRSPVIPEPFPALPHGSGRCGRERFEGGISLQEAAIVPHHSGDLGLLQHELGHHDVVGIPRPPPGEVAAMPAEPRQQPAAKDRCVSERFGSGHCLT